MYINRVRGDISILRECLEETMDTIDLDAIRNADVQYKPYEFLLARDLVRPEKGPALLEEFPEMTKPGYLTVDQDGLSGTFRRFIQELEGPELTEELSVAFDRDLAACPRLTTIMRYSGRKHGAIHTDGESKVLTLLVYLNPKWGTGAEGRLRVLYDGEDVDNFAVEVHPSEVEGQRIPFHLVAIAYVGLLLGEILDFDELAEDCAQDGVYDFFFVAPPLPITGSVGSPMNPQAIK